MNDKFKKENQLSLIIFKNIDNLNKIFQRKFDKINLVSVFGLELQKYLSSSVKSKIFKYKHNSKIIFPFVDLDYLQNNRYHDFTNKKNLQFLDDDISKKINLNYKQIFLKKFYSIKKGDYENFGIDFKKNKIKFDNFFRKINNKKIYFSKIYFSNLNDQIFLLEDFLDKFKLKNNIKNKFFSLNFLSYLETFISHHEYQNQVNADNLIVGSNMNIFNRVMSARFLINKKNVYSLNHANYSSSIYEDPTNDMGEYSMCTFYLDLGKFKFKKKILKSNFIFPKINLFKFKDNDIYKSTYKEKNSTKKILYIPNSYNFFRRYGYHRDVDDKDYIKFQKKIINSRNDIFFKVHPKQRFNNIVFKKNKYLHGNLKKYLNKFDIFIVDMISQPFFDIANTNSKIIYLNFNHRIVRPKVLKLIKKRALVINVKLTNFDKKLLENAIKRINHFNVNNKEILNLCS